MRDLKEISREQLNDIQEGLLAGMDDTLDAGDAYMDEEAFKSFAVGPYKTWKTKTGYVIKGNFKITCGETYDGPRIKTVQGNLAISGTQLKNLEGIFNKDTEVRGTLTIEDNPKLVSLSGCPMTCGTLVITGNKSLKEIDIAPNVLVNAYISKNGRKFKKEQLEKTINVYKHIFCSIEDSPVITESVVNEAVKAPQLIPFINALKKASSYSNWAGQKITVPKDDRVTIYTMFNIEWDKLDASRITEYDAKESKAVTACRPFFTHKKRGIIILMDTEGEVTGFIRGKVYTKLNERSRAYDRWSSGEQCQVARLQSIIENADTILLVDLSGIEDTYLIKRARENAREGSLVLKKGYERKNDPDKWNDRVTAEAVRYYQEIANDNRSRYRKLVAQIKAQRAAMSNGFAAIKTRLDKAFDRYTALLVKMLANPTKYSGYDIGWLNDKFHYAAARDRWTIRESGLFEQLEEYIRFMISAANGNVHGSSIQPKMQQLEAKIVEDLKMVEDILTELEMK